MCRYRMWIIESYIVPVNKAAKISEVTIQTMLRNLPGTVTAVMSPYLNKWMKSLILNWPKLTKVKVTSSQRAPRLLDSAFWDGPYHFPVWSTCGFDFRQMCFMCKILHIGQLKGLKSKNLSTGIPDKIFYLLFLIKKNNNFSKYE